MKYLFTIALLLFSTTTFARPVCDSRAKLVTELEVKYNEAQSGFGLTVSGDQMLELFTANSGTWTILLTRADGISCAMAAGKSWNFILAAPPGKTKNPE